MYKLKQKTEVKTFSDVVTQTLIDLVLEKYPEIKFQDISTKLKEEFSCECSTEKVERLLAYDIEIADITAHMKVFNRYYNTNN